MNLSICAKKWLCGESISVPVLGDLTVLDAEHVEPESLVMLAVAPGPRLSYINDDHVVLAHHIQQLTFVIGREFLRKALTKGIHEAFQPGRHLRIVLNVVCLEKTRSRIDITANQYRSIEISYDCFVASSQLLVSRS